MHNASNCGCAFSSYDSRPTLLIQDISKDQNICIPFIPKHGVGQHILFDSMARLSVEYGLKLDPCCTSKIFIVDGQMALLSYLRTPATTENDKLYRRFLLGLTNRDSCSGGVSFDNLC
jgi:hypothetical protein